MKTKAQVIILVLCFFYIQNKAQVYFNNRYDGSGSCDGTNSVDTFQNKYLSVTDECNSISFYNLSVRLFNQDGTTYKKKTYSWLGSNLLSNTGKYIHIGNHFYTCGLWVYSGYKSKAFLWRFNSNLDSVKFMAYGFSNQANNISHFIKHSDNNIYMVGYVDDTLQTNADILLIKVDTAGNEIWKKKIGVTGMDENAVSIDTLQGNLIIGGYKTIHNTSSSSGFVIRIDTAGNTIWNKNVYTNLGGGCIIKTLKDGNILVYSQYKQYTVGSDDYYRLQVEKITSNNISIWQKRYNVATINSGPSNAIENSDGHIIIAGQKGYTDISVKGTVNVINQNGDSLFYKEFYNEQGSQNYFRDVIQAPDKGYCFAGFIIPVVANGGTGTQDIWLLKIDSNFCESAIPCNSNVGLSEVEALEATVRVYPNPSNGSFVIEIANEDWLTKPLALTLTDCVGNNVYSATVTYPTSTIQTESLANGIYFFTLQTKDKKVTKKIIIQK